MEKYRKKRDLSCFNRSRQMFEQLLVTLGSEQVAKMEHGEVETLLERQGREVLRQMLQDHLDLRASQETRRPYVVGSDGVKRSHVRSRSRPLESVLGRVRLKRLTYQSAGDESLSPMDAELNLPLELYSHGLRTRALEEAARGSFDEVVAAIQRETGGSVAKRQVEELARRAACDFNAFYETRAAAEPEDTSAPLILSVDGKGIIVRPQDLRKTSQQRLAKANTVFSKRRATGEKPRKRMATVAAVYTIDAQQRTPEQVMGELGNDSDDAPRPKPRAQNKRVWASIEHSSPEVIEQAIQEALRRDPKQRRPWVLLVDGDPHQIKRFRRVARKYKVQVTIVLDFIHVIQKLWNAAWAFFDRTDSSAEKWVIERALKILRGQSSQVAAGIRRSATLRGVSGWQRKSVDKAANYFIDNRSSLRYDQALIRGWPIATGIIEGACRYLIKDRMDITGARWSISGAEAVLQARALRTSGDFQEYMAFHRQQEHYRNHACRYADAA